MSRLRSDLWCAAFVRRHNDTGHLCVVARKGDPVAGQIWIEVDHLDGSLSLITPAMMFDEENDPNERWFEIKLNRAAPDNVKKRTAQEIEFDPDFWLVAIEKRDDNLGINLVSDKTG